MRKFYEKRFEQVIFLSKKVFQLLVQLVFLIFTTKLVIINVLKVNLLKKFDSYKTYFSFLGA